MRRENLIKFRLVKRKFDMNRYKTNAFSSAQWLITSTVYSTLSSKRAFDVVVFLFELRCLSFSPFWLNWKSMYSVRLFRYWNQWKILLTRSRKCSKLIHYYQKIPKKLGEVGAQQNTSFFVFTYRCINRAISRTCYKTAY